MLFFAEDKGKKRYVLSMKSHQERVDTLKFPEILPKVLLEYVQGRLNMEIATARILRKVIYQRGGYGWHQHEMEWSLLNSHKQSSILDKR